jgi:hypothetical protein
MTLHTDNLQHRLYHGGFNKNVYILDDEDSSPTTKRRRSAYRLLLGDMDDRSNEDAYIFSVMDLNKQMALPRHVCFKANNDKYGRVTGEHNYIEFTSDDIGDPAVRHSIHANGDGTVRIKSESLSRFWRLDPNWIKADYDYSDNDDQVGEADAATLFRVVKVDDRAFALKLRVLATQGTCNVPFSYYQEDVLTTGEKVVTKFDDGIYRGVNSYDFSF